MNRGEERGDIIIDGGGLATGVTLSVGDIVVGDFAGGWGGSS